ncbi:YALIA101S03e02806g1_1 [Yarrowia lipolytica]|nr:YALIA101S03e02806g1_1 [Yarrowia lipolytica]VBB82290.1 Hypothetical protein conserved in the Yarrowia clade [Yarrowia lipolytica]
MPSRATSTFFDRFDHVDFSWTSWSGVYSFTWKPSQPSTTQTQNA